MLLESMLIASFNMTIQLDYKKKPIAPEAHGAFTSMLSIIHECLTLDFNRQSVQ